MWKGLVSVGGGLGGWVHSEGMGNAVMMEKGWDYDNTKGRMFFSCSFFFLLACDSPDTTKLSSRLVCTEDEYDMITKDWVTRR
jgi:hypothetical protein